MIQLFETNEFDKYKEEGIVMKVNNKEVFEAFSLNEHLIVDSDNLLVLKDSLSINESIVQDGYPCTWIRESVEEDEETTNCSWCDEPFDKEELTDTDEFGRLCPYCKQAIQSRGEELTIHESADLVEGKLKDIIYNTADNFSFDIAWNALDSLAGGMMVDESDLDNPYVKEAKNVYNKILYIFKHETDAPIGSANRDSKSSPLRITVERAYKHAPKDIQVKVMRLMRNFLRTVPKDMLLDYTGSTLF